MHIHRYNSNVNLHNYNSKNALLYLELSEFLRPFCMNGCKYSNEPKHGAFQYISILKATLWELESSAGDTNHYGMNVLPFFIF